MTHIISYKALFEEAPDPIIVLDQFGKVILVNEAAQKLFGFERDELIGTSIELLLPYRQNYDPSVISTLISQYNGLEKNHDYEFIATNKEGNHFFVEVNFKNHEDHGEETTTSLVVRKIENKKRLTRHLEEAQQTLDAKNRELEQFAYIASHDLQEPLRTVASFTQLIKDQYQGKLDADADKYLRLITDATSRMQELIKGLLDYSRLGRERNVEAVDCNALLESILTDLHQSIEESNAKVEYKKLPIIQGYSIEIKQLFQNLISNALKFQKAGVSPYIYINFEDLREYWKFSIQDNGIGIKEKDQQKIFRIFSRLNAKEKYNGTGIGLAHCKKIVELHNGAIWVNSCYGEGSTFYFTIKKANNNE